MKIDMHTHTRYSSDAVTSPKSLLKNAMKKGMDAVAITDHNTTVGWKECMMASDKLAFPIILGEEIKVFEGDQKVGEILAYFITDWVAPGPVGEVLDRIKAQGGISCMAHPFDRIRQGFDNMDKHIKGFDAVEVLNARTFFNEETSRALDFAKKHGKAPLGGSDAHSFPEVGNAYTMADISSLDELKRAIIKRKTRAIGKKSLFLWHAVSSMAKTRSVKEKIQGRKRKKQKPKGK